MKERFLFLALMFFLPMAASADLKEKYVTKNGLVYMINDTENDSKNLSAVAYSMADGFCGTSLDLTKVEMTVEAEWRRKKSIRDDMFGIEVDTSYQTVTVNVIGIDNNFGNKYPQVTSVHLPPSYLSWTYSLLDSFEGLEEVIAEDGNPSYSSNHGLLCNVTGDSLLYVPKCSNQIEGNLFTVPMGIHYDAINEYIIRIYQGDYIYFNLYNKYGIKRICYKDELYAYPSYNKDRFGVDGIWRKADIEEIWFEKNLTPPIDYPESHSAIVHVPSGCAKAYADAMKIPYILEDGGNVDWIESIEIDINARYSTPVLYDMNCVGEKDRVFVGKDGQNNYYLGQGKRGESTIIEDLGSKSFTLSDVYETPGLDGLTFLGVAFKNIYIYRNNDQGLFEVVPSPYQLYVDVDGDGLRDLVPQYNYSNWSIFMQHRDGSFISTEQKATYNIIQAN